MAPSDASGTHDPELARVNARIGSTITAWCCLRVGETFRMDDLATHVAASVGGKIAPGSPGRILRSLRQKGTLDYIVLSRKNSLYRILRVGNDSAAPGPQGALFPPRGER